MNRYRLHCDPGDAIIHRLANMAGLPTSRVSYLLLPNQFPNLIQSAFLKCLLRKFSFSEKTHRDPFLLRFASIAPAKKVNRSPALLASR